MPSITESISEAKERYKVAAPYYNPTPTTTFRQPAPKTALGSAATGTGSFLSKVGQKISDFTPNFIENPVLAAAGWLGQKLNTPIGKMIGDVSMVPPRLASGTLKAGEKRQLEAGKDLRFIPKLEDVPSGIKAALNPREAGIKESWSAGFTGPGSILEQRAKYRDISPEEKAIGLAGELMFPTALDFGAAKLITKPMGKLLKPVGTAAKAVVKKSPTAVKVVETFDPYFRNPEFGKLAKEAQRTSRIKVNEVFKKVEGLSKGLSKEEQAVVGQMIEGLPIKPPKGVGEIPKPGGYFGEQMLPDVINTETIKPTKPGEIALFHRAYTGEGGGVMGAKTYKGKVLTPEGWKYLEFYRDLTKEQARKIMSTGADFDVYINGKLTSPYDEGMSWIRPKEYMKPDEMSKYTGMVDNYVEELKQLKNAPKLEAGAPKGVGKIDNLKLQAIADEVIKMGDEIGQQLVDNGLLPVESVAKYKGKYLPHIWESIKKGDAGFNLENMPEFDSRFMKKRIGATGYMKEFAPPTYIGLGTSTKNIEAAKFYKKVAEDFGVRVDDNISAEELQRISEEGLKLADEAQIPKWRGGESLTGYALPEEIIDYLKQMNVKPGTSNHFIMGLEKVFDFWRKGKTLWNPAYHVRNIISNQFLSNMATGKPFIRTVVDWGQAVRNYYGRGNQAFADAAENIGLIKVKNINDSFNSLLDASDLMDRGFFHKIDDFTKSFQNINEETSKLSVFKSAVEDEARRLNIPINEALADVKVTSKAMDVAEQAIFSPYRLGPAEKEFFKWLVPFYTFSRQAIPFTVKTAVNNPERLAKYPRLKAGVEGLSQNLVPEESRQEWQKGSIQLPEGVSKLMGTKEPLALDTKYLLPFGNFGEDIDVSKGKLPFGLGTTPLFTYPAEAIAGKEFYFDKEFGQGPLTGISFKDWLNANPRQAGTQRLEHFMRTWAPTLYRSIKGKLVPAIQGRKDYAGRDRNLLMAALDTLLGIKLQILRPEDKELFDTWDLKSKIDELEKEMYRINRDERLTPDERSFYNNLAREKFEEILAEE